VVTDIGGFEMVLNKKWVKMFLNAMLGGGYIALILLMIQWVSTEKMGLTAFLIPIGIIVVLTLAGTFLDKKKHETLQTQDIVG